MIDVFIGISERFRCIEGMTARSILAHASVPVRITHLYPEVESGCTGFSDVRYTIHTGIYLDCDMIVLADIAELWGYRRPGHYACLVDGSTEVGVIDRCEHRCRTRFEQHLLPKAPVIPAEWNVEDRVDPGMKLLHFTSLATQPWFHDHPDAAAAEVYRQWAT